MRRIVLREGNVIDNGPGGLARIIVGVYITSNNHCATSPLRLSLAVSALGKGCFRSLPTSHAKKIFLQGLLLCLK